MGASRYFVSSGVVANIIANLRGHAATWALASIMLANTPDATKYHGSKTLDSGVVANIIANLRGHVATWALAPTMFATASDAPKYRDQRTWTCVSHQISRGAPSREIGNLLMYRFSFFISKFAVIIRTIFHTKFCRQIRVGPEAPEGPASI